MKEGKLEEGKLSEEEAKILIRLFGVTIACVGATISLLGLMMAENNVIFFLGIILFSGGLYLTLATKKVFNFLKEIEIKTY